MVSVANDEVCEGRPRATTPVLAVAQVPEVPLQAQLSTSESSVFISHRTLTTSRSGPGWTSPRLSESASSCLPRRFSAS